MKEKADIKNAFIICVAIAALMLIVGIGYGAYTLSLDKVQATITKVYQGRGSNGKRTVYYEDISYEYKGEKYVVKRDLGSGKSGAEDGKIITIRINPKNPTSIANTRYIYGGFILAAVFAIIAWAVKRKMKNQVT